jgi:dTMP kinase
MLYNDRPLGLPGQALPRVDSPRYGMFFSIDGGDGTGKSTQVELFCQWLRDLGHKVVACRDPGSTPLGEAVRQLLLDRHDLPIHRRSEMLLYMAARAQLAEELIRPALQQGQTVVADRYLLANVVYQGYGGGLDVDMLWQVGRLATGGLMPDLTLLLDMPAEAAARRITGRRDRMEQQGADFHARVREGFLAEAARRPNEIVVVNAAGPVEQVQAEIRAAAQRFLDPPTPRPSPLTPRPSP